MNREKSLAINTIILTLGAYLPKLTALITLPLLTDYLSKSDYGMYDLIMTLVSLLLPALTLQVQSAAFRFLINCRDSKEKITAIVTNIFMLTVPVSIVGLIVTYFCLGTLGQGTRVLIVLYFFTDIIYMGAGQIARGLGNNFAFAAGSVVNSIINMISVCIATLAWDTGLDGVVCSMLLGCVSGILLIFVMVKIYRYFSFDTANIQELKKLLAYSWPMVPNALSNWVLSLSNRLVLINFIGIEANATYAVANKIPNLVNAFKNNFTNAWQENASLSVEDTDKGEYYSNMLDSINRLFLGAVALLIIATPVLFNLLIRGDYDAAYQQMSLLYLGVYFSCMAGFMGGIYIAYMQTKSVGITTMCAAICNLLIDLLTVKHIGIYAASISTMISYAFLFVYRLLDCQKFQPLRVDYLKIMLFFLVLFIMSFLVAQRILVIDIINGLLGIVFAITINRKAVCRIIKSLRIKK